MEDKVQNSIATAQLCKEYNWYQNTVPALIQRACDEFFEEKFNVMLFGISQNINCLTDNESCFVTKVRINQEYDMFFRMNDKAIDLILSQVLGQSKNKFNINKISDLEAKVITSFNDYMFETLKSILAQPAATELKRSNWDIVHLTFIIKNKDSFNSKAGKLIATLPKALLNPEIIPPAGGSFSENDFPESITSAKILVGKTKFSLFDIKNLEADDVVVFENSNIKKLSLTVNGNILPVKLNPNMDLLIPEDNDGGDEMDDSQKNIWDSIEVEMSAEFDAVKITLGELKNIEEGLVVDLASLYDNNVTLKVEDKPIASGSLVIVNDRYGVKINNVIAGGAPAVQSTQMPDNTEETGEQPPEGNQEVVQNPESTPSEGQQSGSGDEEFDYSDFELEDDNI